MIEVEMDSQQCDLGLLIMCQFPHVLNGVICIIGSYGLNQRGPKRDRLLLPLILYGMEERPWLSKWHRGVISLLALPLPMCLFSLSHNPRT